MQPWRRRIAPVVLLVVLVWFFWYENETIETEILPVTIASLPEEFQGLRIVVLADLQGREFGKDNGRLIEAVRGARPDLIAICGDLIDTPEELEIVLPLAQQLVLLAPTYYVTGNHEWACGAAQQTMQQLESAGVTVLANAFVTLTRGESRLILAGVHDPNGPYDMMQPEQLLSQIREQAPDVPVVMLSHRNDALEQWAALDVDLVLCGHGHGGVIRLPFVGGLLGTDRELFPEYTAGLYRLSGTQMAVSRGLGNSGVPFRLFNRPHVPVITLEGQ